MSDIKNIIRVSLPTLQITAFALETFDSNDTGIDDELALQIRAVANGLQSYVDSFPKTEAAIARGLQETKAFCENVLTSIDFIITSELDRKTKETEVRKLVKSLSDSKQVYQAKSGQDAKYLDNAKIEANLKLNRLLGIV